MLSNTAPRIFFPDCLSSESFVYGITTLSSYSDGTIAEVTRKLSPGEYDVIKRDRADAARPKVCQRRVCFLWERQAFELRTDLEPAYGVSVLYRRSEVRYRCVFPLFWRRVVYSSVQVRDRSVGYASPCRINIAWSAERTCCTDKVISLSSPAIGYARC